MSTASHSDPMQEFADRTVAELEKGVNLNPAVESGLQALGRHQLRPGIQEVAEDPAQ